MPRQALLITTLLMSLFLSGNVYGQKRLVKADKTYEPNKKIVLKSSYESKDAKYEWDIVYLPKGGFPTPLSDDQYEELGATLYVWGKEGSYMATVRATDFEAKKIEKTKFIFTIGKAAPPIPNPDDPPDPPTPPIPVDDEFTKGCKLALDKELATLTGDARDKKLEKIKTLGLVYKTASKSLTGNQALKTALQMNDSLHTTIKQYMADDELPNFRRGVIQAYMKANLPMAPNTPLTDEVRAKFKEVYAKIGSTIEAITE